MRGMARCDVSIYAPFCAGFYDPTQYRGGGAERQMTLLARSLACRGYRVAHIVYPLGERPSDLPTRLTLVERRAYAGDRPWVGRLSETARIWAALWRADAQVTIVPTGTPVVGVAALFCRMRGRALVFSSASDMDFTLVKLSEPWRRALYKVGVRMADAVVTLSRDQLALAQKAFPGLPRVVHIPSSIDEFPSSPQMSPTERAYLWIGRASDYKEPLRYLDLAEVVPEARFTMIVVPETADSPLRREVVAVASGLPNVEVLNVLPHTEVMDLIATSVAVVNTSRYEGMPNVFLEAWAHGVPVLSLHVDPDGVIARQRLGVSAQGSWEAFVAGARELWANREDRSELSGRARSYVREHHNIEKVTERWIELIGLVVA